MNSAIVIPIIVVLVIVNNLFCWTMGYYTKQNAPQTPPKPPEPETRPEPAPPGESPVRAILASPTVSWRAVQAEVTAYCSCEKCCGKWSETDMRIRQTASGISLAGLISSGRPFCAAPKSIPFGTIIDIPGYGKATVHDRGGAIRMVGGLVRLDVFFPTHREALLWGRRRMEVRIRETEGEGQ